MSVDILIYAEDPGAANYVAGLPAALAELGLKTCLVADGHAYPYLVGRGIRPETVGCSETAGELLGRLKPRLLCVGTSENPDTFGFDLIASAKRKGIKTIGVIDAYGNADYRFRGKTDDPLAYATEWLAVPDPWTEAVYTSLGFPAQRIAVCGHPHYDHVLKEVARLAREDRRRLRKRMFTAKRADDPVVVFVSEISTGLNPGRYSYSGDYTLHGRGVSRGRTEIVIEEFLDALAFSGQGTYRVLRMHPKNTREELASFLNDFQQISQNDAVLELVYASDLVVGMTSMLLMEAAVMGRRTLSVVPRREEGESLPTIRAGITPCVWTRETLRAILPDLLDPCRPKTTMAENEPFVQSGSLQKTAAFITEVLSFHTH
mgnify:CR=1 FL=1